jgi:hypothetical protein
LGGTQPNAKPEHKLQERESSIQEREKAVEKREQAIQERERIEKARDELGYWRHHSEEYRKKMEKQVLDLNTKIQELKANNSWLIEQQAKSQKPHKHARVTDDYSEAVSRLSHNIDNWAAGFPFHDIIQNDIRNPQLYELLQNLGPEGKETARTLAAGIQFGTMRRGTEVGFVRHIIALVLYSLVLNPFCPGMSSDTSDCIKRMQDYYVDNSPVIQPNNAFQRANDATEIYLFSELVGKAALQLTNLASVADHVMEKLQVFFSIWSPGSPNQAKMRKLRGIVSEAVELSRKIVEEETRIYRWQWVGPIMIQSSGSRPITDWVECKGIGDQVLWCIFPCFYIQSKERKTCVVKAIAEI